MGNVYLAINEKANKSWAIKEINKDQTAIVGDGDENAFMELHLLRELHHPFLPEVVDVIETEDSMFLVMDYIEGCTLEQIIKDSGPQKQEDVIQWGIQLCEVLGYLHERTEPIIYRDMKPSNIMLTPEGHIVLIDLGIARIYKHANREDTVCLGTFGYAAPEQYMNGSQTDPRTDIYGLGMTMYALLTGLEPCGDVFVNQPIHNIRPDISIGMEQILRRCLEFQPKQRFQSCAELQYALIHYTDLEQVYNRRNRTKLNRFVSTIIAAMICFVFASQLEQLGSKKQYQDYQGMLKQAINLEDVEEAIWMNPGRPEGYQLWLKQVEQDYVLSEEEQRELQKFRVGIQSGEMDDMQVLDVLEVFHENAPDEYHDFCMECGNLELFYSNYILDTDRYNNAKVWYERVADEEPIAKIYCQIADCLMNIEMYRASQIPQVAKTYTEYGILWNSLEQLYDQGLNVEEYDVQLEIWNEINRIISKETAPICIAVGKDIVGAFLENILSELENTDLTVAEEYVSTLQCEITYTIEKIDSISE